MSCIFKNIKVVLFNFSEVETLEFLLIKLKEVFKIDASIAGSLKVPQDAFDPVRNQYVADYFLEELLRYKEDLSTIVLGVTAVDIYEDGLNFVFGVALPYKVAVISTARLHNRFYGLPEDKGLYLLRVVKEAVHEIGHVIGLPHCPNPKCVMHFSNSLADTDYKDYRFCQKCYKVVMERVCVKRE